jgi:chemotaxis protein CheD
MTGIIAMIKTINIGIGDMAVSDLRDSELVTHSLGSCVGVVVWDPQVNVGGLLHVMLPNSDVNPARAQKQPDTFVDTGLPRLFRAAYARGAVKRRIKVVLAGGAQILAGAGSFDIGKRNYTAVRKMLWRNNVLVSAEEIGGRDSRTVGLWVGSGRVRVTLSARRTLNIELANSLGKATWQLAG